jgi:hypothetical protein
VFFPFLTLLSKYLFLCSPTNLVITIQILVINLRILKKFGNFGGVWFFIYLFFSSTKFEKKIKTSGVTLKGDVFSESSSHGKCITFCFTFFPIV